ncbi:MAG: protein-ADP-ribose hydrolase [Roseburia sp.]|nr:protein-ADP-ribose hydrolase [Roseburia sp.]MCM1097005.1 protein-ADP-ribose hydrolase [Ruminococcus flavefaciens]
MTQTERRIFLIRELLRERPEYRDAEIPVRVSEQKYLLRSLLNVRVPQPVSESFREMQDEYLREAIAEKGITDLADLRPVQENLYLWQGDITTLRCGAIVNAANSRMLGCFCPCHGCIDNAIHTFSGVQLRLACADLMREQGREEPAGRAKITLAYNLPCGYVLHTVGPIVSGRLTRREEELLASCYRSCLELAEENGVESVAFCCISTGEFHFPNQRAAEIAVETVKEYKRRTKSGMKVIFNVFKEIDYEIYRRLLGDGNIG